MTKSFGECLAIDPTKSTIFQRTLASHSPKLSATVLIFHAFADHSQCIRRNQIFNKGEANLLQH